MRNWVSSACKREGHGPTTHLRHRIWWAPWRTRITAACWVCHTPLSPDQARRADEQWLHLFEGWRRRRP